MATDLAIDYNTGDLVASPTKDLSLRTGVGSVEQRMRVRLRVWYGEWSLNPTLGSRIHDVMRMPGWRALTEVELVIREALETMTDVRIQDVVVVQDEKDVRVINVVIQYAVVEATDEPNESFVLTTSLRVGD